MSAPFRHFYPRSPCGERLASIFCAPPNKYISIHALLAESDVTGFDSGTMVPAISIHALLAESDTIFAVRPYDAPIFLSTLSLRRATRPATRPAQNLLNFYPRSPCGERPLKNAITAVPQQISIHALLAESDHSDALAAVSTLLISIHALLAESDGIPGPAGQHGFNFYPRSPCGERLLPHPRQMRH